MALLKQFLHLARPFWGGKTQWREWLLLASIIGFTLFSIFMSVKIAAWDKRFYDALATFNGKAMPALIVEYCGYMGLIIGCIVCGDWLQKRLVFRWRTHLTERFQQNWLGGHKHYRLQLAGEPDNPDQRIADDIYQLADKSIVLFRSFINNIAKFSAFVGVLWGLSGVQHFTLWGHSFTVRGYLVWVALAYSAASTLLAHLVGRRLKDLNIDRQHREADYRAALLRVRDHAEQVAFYQGADAEQGRLQQRYRRILDNWRRLTNCEFRQETFWAAYVRISIFIPIIATLPMYLAKTLTFGDMMQTRTSFARVQDSFGWFTDSYRRLVEWAAVVERLGGFQAALDRADRQSENAAGRMPESDKIPAAQETSDTSIRPKPKGSLKPPIPSAHLLPLPLAGEGWGGGNLPSRSRPNPAPPLSSPKPPSTPPQDAPCCAPSASPPPRPNGCCSKAEAASASPCCCACSPACGRITADSTASKAAACSCRNAPTCPTAACATPSAIRTLAALPTAFCTTFCNRSA